MRNTENDQSQNWLELCRVYDGKSKIHWQVECQYIFKSKKQALVFMNKMDKELQKTKEADG